MIRIIFNTFALSFTGSLLLSLIGILAGITSGSFYTLLGFVTGAFIAVSYTVPAINKYLDENSLS